jgi:lysozyme
MEKLKARLKIKEDLSLIPYKDIYDNWTIGWGHKLIGQPIPIAAAELILDQDIAIAVADVHKLPISFRKHLNVARARVITEMMFNMGYPRFLTFRKMIAAIERQDFDQAAAELLDSKYARKDVGQRAVEMAEILRHGEDNG